MSYLKSAQRVGTFLHSIDTDSEPRNLVNQPKRNSSTTSPIVIYNNEHSIVAGVLLIMYGLPGMGGQLLLKQAMPVAQLGRVVP